MLLIAERKADGDSDRHRPDFDEFAVHALPDDMLIEGFCIVRSIGEGGFGIVYLASDVALERHVAIKEYRPTSLAVRANPSLEVSMRSDRHRGKFDAGLKSFVNEARLLARFDHPSLVKVFRFCGANRTAYMAMPSYEGPTLNATLATADSTPSESQIGAWLKLSLNALSVLHREHCHHRDISPDNILLTTSGPVLLDFGAARDQRHESTCRCDPKPGRKMWRNSGRCSMQGRLVRWLWCLPRRLTRSHDRTFDRPTGR